MGRCMEFDDAVEEHLSFRASLRDAVHYREPLDSARYGHFGHCSLNRWLGNEGLAFHDRPEFWRLCSIHEQFHAATVAVTDALLKEDFGAAEAMLLPRAPYDNISKYLTGALFAMWELVDQKLPAESVEKEHHDR